MANDTQPDIEDIDAMNDDELEALLRGEPDEEQEDDPPSEDQDEATEAESVSEPDPAPEPEPEAVKQPERAPEDTHPAKATVPLHTLQEERQKRKALEERLAALEEAAKPKEEPKPVPDPLTDPDGYTQHFDGQLSEFRQWKEMQEQQARATQEMQQIAMAAQQDAARLEGEGVDFKGAYAFARESRANELRVFGMDDALIAQTLMQDEINLGRQAMAMGKRPGDALVEWARARGWSGGAAAAPERAVPKADAKARNRSLSASPGGKAGAGSVSAENLDNLTDEEFLNNPALRKLLA